MDFSEISFINANPVIEITERNGTKTRWELVNGETLLINDMPVPSFIPDSWTQNAIAAIKQFVAEAEKAAAEAKRESAS